MSLVDPEEESKRKIERAARRRKEKEESEKLSLNKAISLDQVEDMDVDDDFDFDDDLEACNAPSTRKSNSEQAIDSNSPFIDDKPFSFSQKAKDFIQEEKKIEIDFEIPTKSAQLEADMRNLKNDLEAQREYLRRLDPVNLVPIFSSSIECDTVLQIAKAFSNGSKKWVRNN